MMQGVLLGEGRMSMSMCASASEPKCVRSAWATALERLSEVLKTLDETNAPPEIGANLDLTINQLREVIFVRFNGSAEDPEAGSQ